MEKKLYVSDVVLNTFAAVHNWAIHLLSTFGDNLSFPFLRVKNPRGLEDETGRLSRNVGKELPPLAA